VFVFSTKAVSKHSTMYLIDQLHHSPSQLGHHRVAESATSASACCSMKSSRQWGNLAPGKPTRVCRAVPFFGTIIRELPSICSTVHRHGSRIRLACLDRLTTFLQHPSKNGLAYDPNCLNNPHGADSPYKPDGLTNPYSPYDSPYSDKSWTNPCIDPAH
jgi:hypothetical protein